MPYYDKTRGPRPLLSAQSRQPIINPNQIQPRQMRPIMSGPRGDHRAPRPIYEPHTQYLAETTVKLITNAYNITTANSNQKIHEYELSISPSAGCKDLPPKVLSRAFVARSVRKLILDNLVPKLTNNMAPMGSILIEPNLDAIFTLIQFESRDSSIACKLNSDIANDEYTFKDVRVPTDLIARLTIDVTIKFAKTFRLSSSNYTASLLSSIVHHQLLTDMLRYESVYYISSDNPSETMERLDLISRHLIGISLSGVRRCSDNKTLVVINCSHSYITQSHRLIDLLASFVEKRPVYNIELKHDLRGSASTLQRILSPKLTSIVCDEPDFLNFCSIISGFKCRSKDFNGENVNMRFHPTKQSAENLYIDDRTTVFELYRSKGILLNYPNLPCLQSRSKSHPYYPMELCTLMPDQKVPIFRLSSQARNHLVTLNKPHPNLSWRNSVNARNEIAARNKSQFSNFALNLSSKPAEAIGTTLIKPILQYKDKAIFPPRDYWESTCFYQSVDLIENWCLVDTIGLDENNVILFFTGFSQFASKLGLRMGPPARLSVPKRDIMEYRTSVESIIHKCSQLLRNELKFIMFIIDSNSTAVNRLIHLTFDDDPNVTATCIRSESILNTRQHRAIYRTLVHKLNSRLGGTNFTYSRATWERLSLECSDLMIVGLDVTHPDNELSGVSIVGCAYTYSQDLFRHKSLVWPQAARKEIITRMDSLMERLLREYKAENKNKLPHQIIIYRDGVSHEEFERVRAAEINKASDVIETMSRSSRLPKPNLSYIIAQKRHTMRFFKLINKNTVQNPPGGTLIDQGIVPQEGREFYLYSNTSPQATARPLHYHVLLNGLGLENLQKLTYYLCFNFGKCSMSLSMPSSLRYAHNAAYDARNRVIASREFNEDKFYKTKFFC